MDKTFEIAGQTILVTGAGGGIGRVLTKALMERGARVVALDKDANALATSFDADLQPAELITADITNSTDMQSVFIQADENWGGFDAVVNAAGVLPISPIDELDVSLFQKCIDNNLTGAFLITKLAVRHMRVSSGSKRIVHIASVSSQVSNANYAAYAASKAGLSHMVRALGRELAPDGILVNAIGPALIDTPLTHEYLSQSNHRTTAIASIPLGRLCLAEDLIGPLVLLLAKGGSFITGQTIYVDGGRTLV